MSFTRLINFEHVYTSVKSKIQVFKNDPIYFIIITTCTKVLFLRGYCTPVQFLDCFCIFLKNYNTLVTSKICFL